MLSAHNHHITTVSCNHTGAGTFEQADVFETIATTRTKMGGVLFTQEKHPIMHVA